MVAIAPAAADDIALLPLMTADGIGICIVLVVLFVDLQFGEHLLRSLQL
jgi:hypothetical protein